MSFLASNVRNGKMRLDGEEYTLHTLSIDASCFFASENTNFLGGLFGWDLNESNTLNDLIIERCKINSFLIIHDKRIEIDDIDKEMNFSDWTRHDDSSPLTCPKKK